GLSGFRWLWDADIPYLWLLLRLLTYRAMKPVIFVPWLWVGLISLLGCDGASRSGGIPLGARVPIHSEQASFYIDTLYTKLENPWGMVWLPDGVLLITERKGEIIAIDPNGKHDKSLQGFPETYAHG